MLAALSLSLVLAAQAASPAFDEGRRLYFDLEYELAVFRFRDAVRDTELPAKDRALAFAWLGLAYSQVAEMESAKEAFVEAARLDPEVALPKDASPPPKALQLLEDARREALATRETPPAATARVRTRRAGGRRPPR